MRLKIGDLAKMTSCPTVTIRFYEKEGLLSPPERDKANYRVYGENDARRLRFILHCRRHGIKLQDIKKLLELREKPENACELAHNLIDERLAIVDEEMVSLTALKAELLKLKNRPCGANGTCSILESLNAPDGCAFCVNFQKIQKKEQGSAS